MHIIQLSWINIWCELVTRLRQKLSSRRSGWKKLPSTDLFLSILDTIQHNCDIIFLAFCLVLWPKLWLIVNLWRNCYKIFWNDKKSVYICTFNPLSTLQNYWKLIILWESGKQSKIDLSFIGNFLKLQGTNLPLIFVQAEGQLSSKSKHSKVD